MQFGAGTHQSTDVIDDKCSLFIRGGEIVDRCGRFRTGYILRGVYEVFDSVQET